MLRENEFKDNLNLYDGLGQKTVMLEYKGLIIALLSIFIKIIMN